MLGQNKIEIFHLYVLNKDFSVTIAHRSFKFETCILEIQMDGSVSQNFDMSPSFHFMKCRNL